MRILPNIRTSLESKGWRIVHGEGECIQADKRIKQAILYADVSFGYIMGDAYVGGYDVQVRKYYFNAEVRYGDLIIWYDGDYIGYNHGYSLMMKTVKLFEEALKNPETITMDDWKKLGQFGGRNVKEDSLDVQSQENGS